MERTQAALQRPKLEAALTHIESRLGPGGACLDPEQRGLAQEVNLFLQDAAANRSTLPLSHTGYFVHGPPGRGKTWLMSQLFLEAPFPAESKRQVHFHDFFRGLQQQLGVKTSTREAIEATLNGLLDGAQLFLFDELHVHDPGSAALLNRLLAAIAEQGIPTLITSNYEPEGLLPDLMFHHVIEPGIQTLRDHFQVHILDGGTDYRRQNVSRETGFASGRWLQIGPEKDKAAVLQSASLELPSPDEAREVLEQHRILCASAIRGRQIWFSWANLLQVRSVASDFIELATQYDTWFLTDVPPMSQADPASRQRFVTLIDVLVERDLPLTICSTVSRDDLVDIADPPPDMFRTLSRLALLQDAVGVG